MAERDDVNEKASSAEMSWVFEEAGTSEYELCHAHVYSPEIEFCGCHLPGLDCIYVQSFKGEAFKGEDIVVGDEVIGFGEEPLHPGTDAVQLKAMVVGTIANGNAGDEPPLLHLRRHPDGIDGKMPDTAHNPNLIFHYAKEYPDSTDGNKRPFVFAADKNLLLKADSHLTGMVTYHQIDNAQLQEKLNLLLPEHGNVEKGQAMSKATAAIRLNQEHAFMKQYVALMEQRKKLHTEVLDINRSALHGLTHEKKKADSLEKLATCEAEIVELIDVRLAQFRAYSDYDFRQELVFLKAEKKKLMAEYELLQQEIEEKDLVAEKKKTVDKIKELSNLENFAVRDKYDMMEHIHRKELELDGIFEDDEYQVNDDERFPTPAEFWTKVNSKKLGMSLTD